MKIGLLALQRLALVGVLVQAVAGAALAAGACPSVPPGQPPPLDAIAMPKPDPDWQARVTQLNQQIASTDLRAVNMAFLGDSITEGWLPLLFQQFYGHRAAMNFGVRGDTTASMLWRLERLPLGSTLRPRLVVMLIGTNDLWAGANPASVAIGIASVVQEIRDRSPTSHILLLGLLPRGPDATDPLRRIENQVNPLIARCADGMVTFADPGSMLIDAGGVLSKDIAFDYLHLSWIGYGILSAAIEPYVRQILGH
jgi:beta-glucosidase